MRLLLWIRHIANSKLTFPPKNNYKIQKTTLAVINRHQPEAAVSKRRHVRVAFSWII